MFAKLHELQKHANIFEAQSASSNWPFLRNADPERRPSEISIVVSSVDADDQQLQHVCYQVILLPI